MRQDQTQQSIYRTAESKLRRLGIELRNIDDASEGATDLRTVLCEAAPSFVESYVLTNGRLCGDPEFRNLFEVAGMFQHRKNGHKRGRPFYDSRYTQSRPDESFADVFATYVENDGDMNKIRRGLAAAKKGLRVYRQVEWMDKCVRSIASHGPSRR
jgi:hypothetical protein